MIFADRRRVSSERNGWKKVARRAEVRNLPVQCRNGMKIAVTADCHVTSAREHPERLRAFTSILNRMSEEGINTLVVAGDWMDASFSNVSELDRLFRHAPAKDIRILAVPGNHDPRLTRKAFTVSNVEVITEPGVVRIDPEGMPLVMLPFRKDSTMGDGLTAAGPKGLPPHGWILIGHGDWIEGLSVPNLLEPGVYMPLTRVDVETHKPAVVILGHIHKPLDHAILHYPGSPCPLDISETGRRRFLVLDLSEGTVISRPVESEVLYFDESLVVLPLDDSFEHVQAEIASRISSWGLSEDERKKCRIRVRVNGYTSDKKELLEAVTRGFRGFRFYEDAEPDLSGVRMTEDSDRQEIARRVYEHIRNTPWNEGRNEPERDRILLHALRTVYGV
jgi:exonuclease SbcD